MIRINLLGHSRSEQSTIAVLCCPICLAIGKRMVRDHDHKTGFIRGIICEDCNAFVGLHEHKKLKKKRHFEWMQTNWQRISAHMNSNTGIRYSGKRGSLSKTLELLEDMKNRKLLTEKNSDN